MDLRTVLFLIPGFVIGLTVHEAAHAIIGRWLGDNLAGKQGRITLNPFKHLSPLGTLMLFIAGFGWGNPVPVNLYNFKKPKRDYLLCSLAGPVSNILIALISLGLMYGLNWIIPVIEAPSTWMSKMYFYGQVFLRSSMFINMVLAVINLVPIPPLDGSKIWPCLIPGMRPTHSSKTMWIWVIVLIIMLKTGATGKIIRPVIDRVSSLAPKLATVATLEQKRPEDFPEDLYAPSKAVEIEYEYMGEYDHKQCYFLKFLWCESHPPLRLTKWLEQYAEKHHWQAVKSERNDGEWLGKKDGEDLWLFQRRYFAQPDNDTLQIELYRYVDPNSQESSEWICVYFYYYLNEATEAGYD